MENKINKTVTIIIPVFNEVNYIDNVINRVNKNLKFKKQIIVIDDCSTDGTTKILNNLKDKISSLSVNEKNYGKGFCIKKGIEIATGDIILIQDADLEYNPKDYKKLIFPIMEKKCAVVYGSRVLPGAKRVRPKKIIIQLSKIANHFLTALSNFLNKQNLTDAHTCYKAFDKKILNKINLVENGFNFCPEITAKVSKLKIKIFEVPIEYHGRSHKDGKKIKVIDGFKAVYAVIKYNI